MSRVTIEGTRLLDCLIVQGHRWADAVQTLTGTTNMASDGPVTQVFNLGGTAKTLVLPALTGVNAVNAIDGRVHLLINNDATAALTVQANAADGGATVGTVAAGAMGLLVAITKLATPKWFLH